MLFNCKLNGSFELMKLTRAFLFILLFFGIVNYIYSQHPVSIHLTEKDGLPDIEFYDMIEDDKGFIWFACNKGLYRYDGREFKNYTHPEKRGLSVFSLQFDEQNRLWCTNVTGQFFYVENDQLNLFFDTSKELNQEQLFSFDLYGNDIIIFRKNICLKINLTTKKQTVLDAVKDNSVFYYVYSIKKNDTLLLLKTDDKTHINYLVKGATRLKNYISFSKTESASLYANSRNQLIHQELLSTEKLQRRKILKDTIRNVDLQLDNFKINRIYQEANEEWFLTEKGAKVFSFKDSLEGLELIHDYFPTKNVTEVVRDKQDNYWFSTLRNGVFVVPNIHINSYELEQNIGNITAIENVNNTHIYFGTTLGWLGMYDIKNKTTVYKQLYTTSSKVRYILHNKKLNDVYVATNLIDGNYVVNTLNKQIKNLKERAVYGSAKSMVFLNDGRLFSSLVFSHRITKFSKGKVLENKIIALRKKRVYNTFFDAKNEQIYIANVDELVVYDLDFNPTLIKYNNKPIFARGIAQTNDGTIWVSTFKDGVLAIKNNEVIQTYSTENGLLSNQTSYIKADGNNVWITTEKGLQYLSPQQNTFKNLTKKDGIESFNIVGMEIIGNTVWYGSNLGLFSFDKSKVFKPETVVNPYFTSITIADSTYVIKPKYELGYDDKRLAIGFNANEFQSEDNTIFQYKLVGFQNEWRTLPKGRNEVVFNSLSQGRYTFQLRTVNDSEVSEIEELHFEVKGAIYKQWWFVLLSAIGVLGYFIFYFKRTLKQQKARQHIQLEHQRNELENAMLKLENLRSQMNPHFIFNALNSIQDYILTNEKSLARSFLVKFSRLIRMYLEHSQKSVVSLDEELTALNLYLQLEKVRFEDSFNYSVSVSENINPKQIQIPAFLVQPYVENAIKHGLLHKKDNRLLHVYFKLNDAQNILHIVIDDNGIGRTASSIINSKKLHKPKSFSSSANLKRIELLNKTRKHAITLHIKDKNSDKDESVGTQVNIKIPLD